MVLYKQGKLDDVLYFYKELLDIRKKILPKNHPDMCKTMSELGTIFMNLNKLDEAELIYRECFEIRKQIHP